MAKTNELQRGEIVKDYLLRPFMRRQTYLYTGLSTGPDCYVLGSVNNWTPKDRKAEYETRDPNQSVALVIPRCAIVVAELRRWLQEFQHQFNIPTDVPGAINLTMLAGYYTKTGWLCSDAVLPFSWNMDGVLRGPDRALKGGETRYDTVYTPTFSQYFYATIETFAQNAMNAAIRGDRPVCRYSVNPSPTENLLDVIVPHADLQTVFGETYPGLIRVALTKGVDAVSAQHLTGRKKDPDIPTFHGVVLWRRTADAFGLDYGHLYDSPTTQFLAYRPYACAFPRRISGALKTDVAPE